MASASFAALTKIVIFSDFYWHFLTLSGQKPIEGLVSDLAVKMLTKK
jgi:hypothetical protein